VNSYESMGCLEKATEEIRSFDLFPVTSAGLVTPGRAGRRRWGLSAVVVWSRRIH
jgi:hypothetical protein